jgi:hydrogenase-4 component E
MLLVRPVEAAAGPLVREHIAAALSVVLLGLLVMVSRRNAISQVIGFMALENGVSLAAIGVRGMPLVVEVGIAFLVLIAVTLFGLFFFRIRERFETLDLSRLERFRGEGE